MIIILIDRDVRDSNLFLNRLSEMRPQLRFDRAADCGAGIGRVSKNFLLKRFESVELVEQSPRLLRAAPEYLGEDAARATYLLQGLQVASANQYYLYYYQLNLNSLIV